MKLDLQKEKSTEAGQGE